MESTPPTLQHVLQALEETKISEAHYSAIGKVAGRWAYFEAIIETWLWVFANLEAPIGVCFTSHMNSRARIEAFVALVKNFSPDTVHLKALDAVAKDMVGLSEQRNRAVHDIWDLREPTKPVRREATAKRNIRLLDIHVPTEDLYRLIGNIQKLIDRFDETATAIFNELKSSPDKFPSQPLF